MWVARFDSWAGQLVFRGAGSRCYYIVKGLQHWHGACLTGV